MPSTLQVTLNDIKQAQTKINSLIALTPCDYSRSASVVVGADIFLKLENTQRTGSFKIRGASNKITNLTDQEKKRGVIACSAGNHAQGVALSSTLNKVRSVIVMPVTASISKVQATRAYGAEVVLHGQSFDESKEHAYKLAEKEKFGFCTSVRGRIGDRRSGNSRSRNHGSGKRFGFDRRSNWWWWTN